MNTRWMIGTGIVLMVVLPALAADWPQFSGPNRDAISPEKDLRTSWPKEGPPLLWTYKNAGLGFSSPSIVGNKLYTMGARKEKTHVIALDISGKEPKELWSYEVGPLFASEGNTSWGDGPRGAPTVDGDYLYALGGFGDLVCLKTSSGELVWRKSFVKDLDGEIMKDWGYCESVLVDGDNVICTPGGSKGTFAALDKKSGKVIWRSDELICQAPYSSLLKATLAGVPQYVGVGFAGADGSYVMGINPKNGKVLWKAQFQKGDTYCLCFTPVIKGNQVYLCEGDGGFCHKFEISSEGDKLTAKDTYSRRVQKNMKNNHGGVVLQDGFVYGYTDRLGWVCQNWKTGKNAWEDSNKLNCKGSGAIAAADGHLYLYSDLGEAVLLKASSEGWQEKGRFAIPEKSTLAKGRPTSRSALIWTHPVIANGQLFLRDQELIFCYDIKANK